MIPRQVFKLLQKGISMVAPLAAAAGASATSFLLENIKSLLGDNNFNTANKVVGNAINANINSVTAFGKMGRISSRVYIDQSVATDPVIADILKSVQTQYCGFILTALQLNQFVGDGNTVQDLLKVVATEDYKDHKSVVASFGVDSDRVSTDRTMAQHPYTAKTQQQKDDEKEDRKTKREEDRAWQHASLIQNKAVVGKGVSFASDDSLPTGKIIEVTLVNPNNPEHKINVNLLVQLAPYIVPEELAVKFISKDVVLPFIQRLIQWKTGEISFWKDLILGSDLIHDRAKMLKLDPSGVFADMMSDQQKSRGKTMMNISKEENVRARNVANSVLIFNNATVQKARAESGFDLNDFNSRQKYFGMTYAMIIVVVDMMYNQITFYYNGISDYGTFSFDQMKSASKNGNMDLVSVMNSLNQGKSPKF